MRGLNLKFIIACSICAVAATFKAAFVEHYPTDPCGGASCGERQKATSARQYAALAKEAAKQGAQIVVFPEYGITGESSYPANAWLTGGYTESWSADAIGKIPCNSDSDFPWAPTIVKLSCAAADNKIVIVANLIEYSKDKKFYNTDIAFDSDGTFLATYHKMNLWGEGNIDVPPVCDVVSFETKFGETFGMFTCADIIHQHPASNLLEKKIKHFVHPVGWTNEMAQMQTLAYTQGWSAVKNVNLITSNLKGQYSSGSGVFVSGRAANYTYAPGWKDSLFIAEIPSGGRRLAEDSPVPLKSRFNLKAAGSNWKFAPLADGKICSGATCCKANVTSGRAENFVLGALDGIDNDGHLRWPAQVCAVLPCRSPGTWCLDFQGPVGNLLGVELEMTGLDQGDAVPEVVATHGQDSEVLLLPGSQTEGYTFELHGQAEASLQVNSKIPLTSALIYGRPFARDQLPYTCPSASSAIFMI